MFLFELRNTVLWDTFTDKVHVPLLARVIIPGPSLFKSWNVHQLHAIFGFVRIVWLSRGPIRVRDQLSRSHPRKGALLREVTSADPEGTRLLVELVRGFDVIDQSFTFRAGFDRHQPHPDRVAKLDGLEPVGPNVWYLVLFCRIWSSIGNAS